MVETAKKQWYVLHTYSGFEDKVRSDLLSRAQSLGMQGYVLVEMVMTDESWFVVRNTPNVTGFVGSHGGGSKPSPLYDDEVAAILQMQGEPAKKKRDIHFEVGESVKITEGAFNGMVGKISDIQEDKEKLYLTIDMFGHATTAELDYDQVDKIDD